MSVRVLASDRSWPCIILQVVRGASSGIGLAYPRFQVPIGWHVRGTMWGWSSHLAAPPDVASIHASPVEDAISHAPMHAMGPVRTSTFTGCVVITHADVNPRPMALSECPDLPDLVPIGSTENSRSLAWGVSHARQRFEAMHTVRPIHACYLRVVIAECLDL